MTDVPWELVAAKLVHPIPVACLRMLAVEDELSAKDMSARLRKPLGQVSYHVRLMYDAELIKRTRTETARGALQHFYALRNHRMPGRLAGDADDT